VLSLPALASSSFPATVTGHAAQTPPWWPSSLVRCWPVSGSQIRTVPPLPALTALGFCDAQGLSALVRMAGYAERAGRPFRLVSPSPSVVKIMRITGLDRRFLVSPASGPPES